MRRQLLVFGILSVRCVYVGPMIEKVLGMLWSRWVKF
jgi:hypothetical protein